jgi:hypothetical protein
MFRMLKLEPPHGWRPVFWELGIVTIGVLLALGAQQLVETIHWNREVAHTRKALDAELAHNLAAFDYRISQRPCVAARLAELKQSLARQRQGQVLPLKRPIASPIGFGLGFSVWEVASGEARSRMPIRSKLQYASLYDMFRHFVDLDNSDDAEWSKLEDFDFAGRMDPRDVQLAAGVIKRLEDNNRFLSGFIAYRRDLARPLRIEPEKAIESTIAAIVRENDRALCTPLI